MVFIQKMFLAAVLTSSLERSSGKTDFNVKVLLHVDVTEGTGTSPTVVTTRQVPSLPGKTVQVVLGS